MVGFSPGDLQGRPAPHSRDPRPAHRVGGLGYAASSAGFSRGKSVSDATSYKARTHECLSPTVRDMQRMDTREWVIVMVLGGVIALIGRAAVEGWSTPLILGLGIVGVGFVGWQVSARLALKRSRARAPESVDR